MWTCPPGVPDGTGTPPATVFVEKMRPGFVSRARFTAWAAARAEAVSSTSSQSASRPLVESRRSIRYEPLEQAVHLGPKRLEGLGRPREIAPLELSAADADDDFGSEGVRTARVLFLRGLLLKNAGVDDELRESADIRRLGGELEFLDESLDLSGWIMVWAGELEDIAVLNGEEAELVGSIEGRRRAATHPVLDSHAIQPSLLGQPSDFWQRRRSCPGGVIPRFIRGRWGSAPRHRDHQEGGNGCDAALEL